MKLIFVFNVKFTFKKLIEIVLIDGVVFEKVLERKVRGEEVEVDLAEIVVRNDEVVEFVSETVEVGVKDVVDVIVKVVEEDDKIVEVLAEEVVEVVVEKLKL